MATFPTTNWPLVLATRRLAPPPDAMDDLCAMYWYPVYAYLRRRGHRCEEAEDLTQGFFAHMLGKRLLSRAEPEKGRLRSLLLAALSNYVANERDRQLAKKRQGAVADIDMSDAESRYSAEGADNRTPERLYEREWAAALLERVLQQLRHEFVANGRGLMFDLLKSHLVGEPDDVSYRAGAATLGVSEGALRVAVHRLRRRYRDLLRSEIARTVSGPPQQVDDEIRYLFDAARP